MIQIQSENQVSYGCSCSLITVTVTRDLRSEYEEHVLRACLHVFPLFNCLFWGLCVSIVGYQVVCAAASVNVCC